MARRVLVLLGLSFFFSISARAQNVELFGGYTYEGLKGLPNALPGRNLSGVETSLQYKFRKWFGVLGEVNGYFALPAARDTRSLNIMGGPQISIPWRFSPFAHILVGVGHVKTDGIWDTSRAEAIGGGIDMHLAPLLSWRMIEADNVFTGYFGGTQHNLRISTGIVLRF